MYFPLLAFSIVSADYLRLQAQVSPLWPPSTALSSAVLLAAVVFPYPAETGVNVSDFVLEHAMLPPLPPSLLISLSGSLLFLDYCVRVKCLPTHRSLVDLHSLLSLCTSTSVLWALFPSLHMISLLLSVGPSTSTIPIESRVAPCFHPVNHLSLFPTHYPVSLFLPYAT